MKPPSIDSSERIYKAAASLFSRKGYDGTSMRDIATAVGLNISTVNYHVGSKETLYREILLRTYEMEYQLFSSQLENVPDGVIKDVDELKILLNHTATMFIQRILDEPETYRLWAYHFLEETNQVDEMKKEFSSPIYDMVLAFMRRARQAGTIAAEDDFLRMFIVAFSWMLHGYFNGLKNDWGDPSYSPFLPSNIDGLKNFINVYIERMLVYRIDR
jgi:AcrR family transcriptional regulator